MTMSDSEISRALEGFREDAYVLVHDLAVALARLDEWHALGFRSHTAGAGPASSTPPAASPLADDTIDPSKDADDEGPVEWTPVETAALFTRDNWTYERTMLLARVESAAKAAKVAGDQIRALTVNARVRPGEVVDPVRCWVHAQAGFPDVDPDPKGSLVPPVTGQPSCRRCSEFFAAEKRVMPPQLVRYFEEHHKLPPAVVAAWRREEAVRAVPEPKRKKRRRGVSERLRRDLSALEEARGSKVETAEEMRARFESREAS